MTDHEWSTEMEARLDQSIRTWARDEIPTPAELGMKEAVELFRDNDLQNYFEALDACR